MEHFNKIFEMNVASATIDDKKQIKDTNIKNIRFLAAKLIIHSLSKT